MTAVSKKKFKETAEVLNSKYKKEEKMKAKVKVKALTAFVLLLCALLSAACPAFAETEETETEVTDMIGRTVSVVPGSYERVVCIGAGALRMYSYICGTEHLCGVEDIDSPGLDHRPKIFDGSARPYVLAFGEKFGTLPSCGTGGPNAQSPEAEKILSCDPDVIISEFEDTDVADALQEMTGVPVITLRTGPAGIFADEFRNSMRLLGKIFGREARAEELLSFVDKELADISARTADIPEDQRPGVYICGLGNWGTTNHLMTSENYAPFQAANIRNAVSGLGIRGVGTIEEEKFVSIGDAVDVMFIDAAAVKNIRPLIEADPELFDTCRAWQNSEVYLEMAYNAYYINYEISLANAWFLAKTVYPERFSDVDLTEKLDGITEQFLGKRLSSEIFACENSFGGYQKLDTAAFFG